VAQSWAPDLKLDANVLARRLFEAATRGEFDADQPGLFMIWSERGGVAKISARELQFLVANSDLHQGRSWIDVLAISNTSTFSIARRWRLKPPKWQRPDAPSSTAADDKPKQSRVDQWFLAEYQTAHDNGAPPPKRDASLVKCADEIGARQTQMRAALGKVPAHLKRERGQTDGVIGRGNRTG
jgi:hypothetical protein